MIDKKIKLFLVIACLSWGVSLWMSLTPANWFIAIYAALRLILLLWIFIEIIFKE